MPETSGRYAGIRFDCEKYHAIKKDLLDTFAYEHSGKNITVTVSSDEFSAVCPWSGLPDYGKITVEYIPGQLILELKSFKYYLCTFRQVGIFQEHAINIIFDDLQNLLKPVFLKIVLSYNTRGGIDTVVTRQAP
ncbi:MAG TPA: NADPH-dependent 7-cyano-7-deazaguanine reductase QueF [Spirochaetia bacterium]|nr:NADPH-dependent 7-cyano-7-deazaguanine reductase QueF [Spirochaetia bacterium]